MTEMAANVSQGSKSRIPSVLKGRRAVFVGTVLALLLGFSFWAQVFPPDPDRLEPGTIVIMSGEDQSVDSQREQLLIQWNSIHPDSPAIFRTVSGDADAQHSAMVSQAQTADATVDIYNLDVTWTTEFAEANYIRPIGGVSTDGFLAKPLSTCKVGETLYALPFNTDAGLLYYRTDLATGPPELPPSPETMANLARGHADLKGGYAMQLGSYEGLTVNALEAIWAAKGDVLDNDGHVTIDSAEVATALTDLARASDSSAGIPGIWAGSYGTSGRGGREGDSTKAFADAAVAFMRNWPVAYGQLANRTEGPPVPFQVTHLPGPSVLGGSNLAIATDTRRPRAATKLIEFLTNDDSEKQLFREGALPATRASAYADANVRAARPYATTLLEALNNARPRPVTANYPLFSYVFQRIIGQALRDGGRLPGSAVQDLTNALNGRLE
jgi:multiple sugar transport system substrate-binding protein